MINRILIVEPDQVLANIYTKLLINNGYQTIISSNADSAIKQIDEFKPDLVLLEIQLVEHSGIELLYEIRSYIDLDPIKVIIFSRVPYYEFKDSISSLKKDLMIDSYLYKPETKLTRLLDQINRISLNSKVS